MKTLRYAAGLLLSLLLVACGGEDSNMTFTERDSANSLIYSYPAHDQTEVVPGVELVLRFSKPVAEPQLMLTDGETVLDHSLRPTDGERSWVITPAQPLQPLTDYRLQLAEALQVGERTLESLHGADGIRFTTRGEDDSFQLQAQSAAEFGLAARIPDGDHYPVLDFSTLRLRFTQPVHPDGVVYGASVRLEDAAGNLVPATLRARGRHLVVDPVAASPGGSDKLQPGQPYTLVLDELPNLTRTALLSDRWTFVPLNSGPTEILYQATIPNSESLDLRSPLNGGPLNGIQVRSTLMGDTPVSYKTGAMWAELAYSPNFPEMTPLRVPRGTVLQSTSLDVLVGGLVPIRDLDGDLQRTGELKVTMISDAIGYLYPNPYTHDPAAPRHVRLFMDVAMSTTEAQPNAALTQDLLGLELVGLARVRQGALEIDALSVVEPRLLGQDRAIASLAFGIRAETVNNQQRNAPEFVPDPRPAELLSWTPGDDDMGLHAAQRPGRPLVLFFSKPLDPATLAGVRLYQRVGSDDFTEIHQIDRRLDGTALILSPVDGLQHHPQGRDYRIEITPALQDLQGTGAQSRTLEFSMAAASAPRYPEYSFTNRSGTEARIVNHWVPPVVLTAQPGFPCATTDLRLAQDDHGYCLDAAPATPVFPRDRLPVTQLPANRHIELGFSQSMNLASINAHTFWVEQVALDSAGNVVAATPVSGRLEKRERGVRFIADQPWTPGVLYRYTLKGHNSSDWWNAFGDGQPEGLHGACRLDPATGLPENPAWRAVCSVHGVPLNTRPIQDPLSQQGPDLTVYFRGAPPSDYVLTALANLPVRDANANYWLDDNEPFPFGPEQLMANGHYPTPPNAARLEINGTPYVLLDYGQATLGCHHDPCPDRKFIYQVGALLTDILGPVEDHPALSHPFEAGAEDRGIRALMHPTLLVVTGLEMHLSGDPIANLILGSDGQDTGPQLMRMRYAKDDPACDEQQRRAAGQPPCPRSRMIEGRIFADEQGQARFKTRVDVTLDAPLLDLPLADSLSHNLFSYPITLELEGDMTFYPDGRMQVEQYNLIAADIDVRIVVQSGALSGVVDVLSCLRGIFTFNFSLCSGGSGNSNQGAVRVPLQIPAGGIYLNYLGEPMKPLPAQD